MIEIYLHKHPMDKMIRCIVDAHSIKKTLEVVNEFYAKGFTEDDVIQWKHISKEDALKIAAEALLKQ